MEVLPQEFSRGPKYRLIIALDRDDFADLSRDLIKKNFSFNAYNMEGQLVIQMLSEDEPFGDGGFEEWAEEGLRKLAITNFQLLLKEQMQNLFEVDLDIARQDPINIPLSLRHRKRIIEANIQEIGRKIEEYKEKGSGSSQK